MSYPKTMLTKPIRRAIMICLIIIFFVTAPLVILYTAGYRYNFSTREIKQTGVVSIDVEPNDATAEIGSIVIKKKMPLRLPNRAPGTYHLKITRPGYQAWEKDITVESKQTVYIRDVTLFKEAIPRPFGSEPIEPSSFSSSYEGAYALHVLQKDTMYELGLIDTGTKSQDIIARGAWEKRPDIFWSPRHDAALLIEPSADSTRTVHLVHAQQKKIIDSLSIAASSTPVLFQWQQHGSEPSVWIQDGEHVALMKENGGGERIELPPLRGTWFHDGRDMWIYDTEARTVHRTNDPTPAYSVEETITSLLDINNDRIIGSNGWQVVVLARNSDTGQAPHLVGATKTRLNAFTGEWNVWSQNELWTIYPDGRVVLLNRTSEPIQDVHPLDRFGVLLLGTHDRFIGFNPGYYVSHTLLSGGTFTPIAVNQQDRKIYFSGQMNGKTDIFELAY